MRLLGKIVVHVIGEKKAYKVGLSSQSADLPKELTRKPPRNSTNTTTTGGLGHKRAEPKKTKPSGGLDGPCIGGGKTERKR